MTHRVLCCALGLALPFAAPSAAQTTQSGVDPEWFPLRAGSEWVYEAHRDQTYHPDHASINRAFHIGHTKRVAEAAPERAPDGFLVRETTVLRPVEGRSQKETISAWTVFSFGKELRIHASSATRADGSTGDLVYEQPLRILPTAQVGVSWNAGTFRSGSQQAKVRGEVLGVEDLEGNPGWTDCLKIRLKGPISGIIPRSEPPSEIEAGDFERLLWFAKGVGIVRDVTTVSMTIRLPDERRVNTIEVNTLRLVEHRGAK